MATQAPNQTTWTQTKVMLPQKLAIASATKSERVRSCLAASSSLRINSTFRWVRSSTEPCFELPGWFVFKSILVGSLIQLASAPNVDAWFASTTSCHLALPKAYACQSDWFRFRVDKRSRGGEACEIYPPLRWASNFGLAAGFFPSDTMGELP